MCKVKIGLFLFFAFSFIGSSLDLSGASKESVGQASFKVNSKNKVKQIKQLVDNAVKHLDKVSLEQACNDFIYNPTWRKGELYVWIVDENGVTYASGDDTDSIWKTAKEGLKKEKGTKSLIEQMLAAGPKGKFVGYNYQSSYKSSFVKVVEKDGTKYILGAGFYPEDHHYIAKHLVLHAAKYLSDYGAKDSFSIMSSPVGDFIKGNTYIEAYDFDGNCVANAKFPAFVGQSFIDKTDSRGMEITQKIIEVAKTKGNGFIDFYPDSELKRLFVMKAVDPKTKKPYAITAGYYKHRTLQNVKSFVNRAIAYIKENGSDNAFKEFTNPVGKFVQGGLAVTVYDLQGKCLANGYQPEFVGQNLINYRDDRGYLFVKEMIKGANKHGETIYPVYLKNASEINYSKKIDVPDGKFIVSSSYFPESKKQSVETLLGQAKDHFNSHGKAESFNDFSTPDGIFVHGDIHIFVYDINGVRLVNGTQKGQIWLNFLHTTDQDGKEIIDEVISTALNGGGWLDYKTRNEQRKVYVQEITKKNAAGKPETFVIGSGYFL